MQEEKVIFEAQYESLLKKCCSGAWQYYQLDWCSWAQMNPRTAAYVADGPDHMGILQKYICPLGNKLVKPRTSGSQVFSFPPTTLQGPGLN